MSKRIALFTILVLVVSGMAALPSFSAMGHGDLVGTPTPFGGGGGKIAFMSIHDRGNSELYVMGADGKNPRNLTNNITLDFEPTWSPDGMQIAFQSFRDWGYEIYTMDADGSGLRRLTNNKVDDIYPSWQPAAKPGA